MKPAPTQLDETLAKARRRDEAAFADVMRAHQAMVYGLAYHMIGSRTVAEDIAQEVFLRLYQRLPSIESPSHLRFWLRRVTSQRCIDYSRRRRTRPEVDLDTAAEPAAAPAHSDTLLERRLRQLVASLSPRARAIVTLRYQEDLPPHEIAELLGERVNTIKSVLQRSLIVLRARMKREMAEPRR